jgi:dihydrofolate reductase
MATVIANMSVSLDGFVADSSDGIEQVFAWYGAGDVEVPTSTPGFSYRVSAASADHLRGVFGKVRAVVSGRRTFDLAGGWGGRHPVGAPVWVVTHTVPEGWPREDSDISFVTDGVASAVAQARAAAGDGWIAVASPDITQQCLNLGLLDEIRIDLVPVLLGQGVRLFDNLAKTPVALSGPTVVEGTGVTHLAYAVKR